MALTRKYIPHESLRGRRRILPESNYGSLTQMADELPPVVYFMRDRDGLVKIGHTTNLAVRRRAFGSGWGHILAIIPGSREDERAMHARFAKHLAHDREYFHPAPELIAYINTLREALGVPPLRS